MEKLKKILLPEKDIPENWYNIQADMPNPTLPPLHPGTKQPIGPGRLAPLFPMELIKQEVSKERWIGIPEEVRDIYKIWRPSPLFRAYSFEKLLAPLQKFIISMRVSALRAHINQTPRFRKHIII